MQPQCYTVIISCSLPNTSKRYPVMMKVLSVFLFLVVLSTNHVSSFVIPASTTISTASAINCNNVISSKRGNTSSSSLSFFKKNVPEPEAVLIQPSPSGVNTLPESTQAAIFFAIFAALGALTIPFSSFLDTITLNFEWVQTWRYTWPLLGAIYAAAGVTHFTIQDDYENIYPEKGAWGIWYLPGSSEFHVKWTGVAEILGGLGLLIGGAFDAFAPVYSNIPNLFTDAGIGSDSAAALLLLTIAVTPANIYMYTHGAKLPVDGPEIPITGHVIRGVMQVVLFGLLYQMGQGTFEALL